MKVFVTGGSGHLGKVLVDYLQKDHDVLAPNSKECNVLNTYNLYKTIKDLVIAFYCDKVSIKSSNLLITIAYQYLISKYF